MRGGFLEEKGDRILSLKREGLSDIDIAAMVGCSSGSVWNFLNSVGVHGKRSGQTVRDYSFFGGFNQHQVNVLIGTLLGDGGVYLAKGGRHPYLSFGHCDKQEEYMLWKAAQFGTLFKRTVARKYPGKSQIISRCHPSLMGYRELFYSRIDNDCGGSVLKKRITSEIIDLINDEVLAVWIADDGYCNSHGGRQRPDLGLCVGGGLEEEYLLVENYLLQRGWGVSRRHWLTNGNCVEFGFNAESSEEVWKVIRSFLPACIKFKFGSMISCV